jgi:hypothetical protein
LKKRNTLPVRAARRGFPLSPQTACQARFASAFNGLRARRRRFFCKAGLQQCKNCRLEIAWYASCVACGIDYTNGDHAMGKYVLAWLLGVPGIVLVIVYFLFN